MARRRVALGVVKVVPAGQGSRNTEQGGEAGDTVGALVSEASSRAEAVVIGGEESSDDVAVTANPAVAVAGDLAIDQNAERNAQLAIIESRPGFKEKLREILDEESPENRDYLIEVLSNEEGSDIRILNWLHEVWSMGNAQVFNLLLSRQRHNPQSIEDFGLIVDLAKTVSYPDFHSFWECYRVFTYQHKLLHSEILPHICRLAKSRKKAHLNLFADECRLVHGMCLVNADILAIFVDVALKTDNSLLLEQLAEACGAQYGSEGYEACTTDPKAIRVIADVAIAMGEDFHWYKGLFSHFGFDVEKLEEVKREVLDLYRYGTIMPLSHPLMFQLIDGKLRVFKHMAKLNSTEKGAKVTRAIFDLMVSKEIVCNFQRFVAAERILKPYM